MLSQKKYEILANEKMKKSKNLKPTITNDSKTFKILD